MYGTPVISSLVHVVYRDFATVMSLLQRGLMLYTSSSQLYIHTCRGRVQCHFAHTPADTDVDCVLSLFKDNIMFSSFFIYRTKSCS